MAQDYIIRMLQQIGVMIAAIVRRREAGDLPGAEAELREQCLSHVGLPLEIAKHATPEDLAELLATGGALRHTRGIFLAELLVQDAALAEQRGNPPEAVLGYQQAFHLLHDALPFLPHDEEKHYRARLLDISAKLRDLGSGAA